MGGGAGTAAAAGVVQEGAGGEAADLEGGEIKHSMMLPRCEPIEMKMKRNADLIIALAGNPNA